MKTLYIDCGAGVSGDMLLAALLDLTAARDCLEKSLAALGVGGFELQYPSRRRGGVEAHGVDVVVRPAAPHFHDLAAIEDLMANAPLSPFVVKGALATFRRLAAAEREAHRVAYGHVGFHEVGAVDAVVDVVGTFVLLEVAAPERIIASPLRLGRGFVTAAHGPLPIPAPATAALVRGIPTYGGDVDGEFTTPTGAALITSLADGFGPQPVMKTERIGYGPGHADPPGLPNVLRVFLGEASAAAVGERVAVIEANVDDMTPEEIAYATAELLAADTLDVTVAPVIMKKGRPGYTLTLLCKPAEADRVVELVFKYTTTLGVRTYDAARRVLTRDVAEVDTAYGRGRVKIAVGTDGVRRFHAEYESAASLARATGAPVREVARALEAAAAALFQG